MDLLISRDRIETETTVRETLVKGILHHTGSLNYSISEMYYNTEFRLLCWLITCMRSNSTRGNMSSMVAMSLVNLFMILPGREEETFQGSHW